jgi:transposase-like protein
MMSDERKKYDKEFKQKAVEHFYARGSATQIAEELGIRPQMLYRRHRELKRYEKIASPAIFENFITFRLKVNGLKQLMKVLFV